MQDNDWMIPRELHGVSAAASTGQAEGRMQVDPEFLYRRRLRKERLSPQPHTATAGRPWLHSDRSMGGSVPAFPNRLWTLGDTARWVIERTPEAVNGLSIEVEKLFKVLPEIHEAFSSGEVPVFANTLHNPIPRELPAETWSVYELLVEEKDGLVRIFASNLNFSGPHQPLLDIRVNREDVLQKWPDPANPARVAQPMTTKAAENQCRRWLVAMMRENPNKPRPKAAVCAEALAKFRGLGKRGFSRAWDAAIREANALKWRDPGRRT